MAINRLSKVLNMAPYAFSTQHPLCGPPARMPYQWQTPDAPRVTDLPGTRDTELKN